MKLSLLAVRLHLGIALALSGAVHRRGDRDDRGDVPGWVMVTVMTAGLCAALVAIAKPQLSDMLRTALDKVK
jgi:uncharacterized membrane protein HdeD (DUF308 family)